jgi:hypothetical protein
LPSTSAAAPRTSSGTAITSAPSESAPPAPPAPAPTESAAPEPTAATPVVAGPAEAPPRSGSGAFVTAALNIAPNAQGRIVRYAVQVEDGVPVDPLDFARSINITLVDPRGWQAVDGIAFEEVADPTDASIIVTLATPDTTDRLCAPLDTGGWLDCYSRGRAVINSDRWLLGAVSWGDDLDGYRHQVVNHEVGHAIGHGHAFCPGAGAPAPVMQQQTISLQGCAPNAWPQATGG